jgi:hypothetical protein
MALRSPTEIQNQEVTEESTNAAKPRPASMVAERAMPESNAALSAGDGFSTTAKTAKVLKIWPMRKVMKGATPPATSERSIAGRTRKKRSRRETREKRRRSEGWGGWYSEGMVVVVVGGVEVVSEPAREVASAGRTSLAAGWDMVGRNERGRKRRRSK